MSFEKGLETRKEILGEEFVDRQFSNATDFSRPLQELVTDNCFGDVWSREGLSRRDRSLLTVALLAALNRGHALEAHVKAAVTNGATVEEIRETLVHTIPYCGFPAAFDAFEIAERALSD